MSSNNNSSSVPATVVTSSSCSSSFSISSSSSSSRLPTHHVTLQHHNIQHQQQHQHQQPHNIQQVPQLGTFRGAYLPSLQSILGVILFLRLTHITSQAGCIFTTLLLLISTASTLFTWSSLSAIVTNGSIQSAPGNHGGGGPYYIISRTLGADIGASLGTLYYIGNTLSGSMFVLGIVEAFHYSIRAYYARWGYGFSGHLFQYDTQILSILIIVCISSAVHIKQGSVVVLLSNLFLGVTILSIICVIGGVTFFALDIYNGNLQPYDRSYYENLWPRYEPDPYTGVIPDFFSCLSLIYPSVTGILNGMSKSHQLKNPSHSIPRGTFWSILTSSTIYLLVCWLFGMSISNRTLKVDKFVTASVSYPHELVVRVGVMVSALGLVLGCMSTAPNLLVAMSEDEVMPCLNCLTRNKKSTMALWFTAVLVALPTLGGNIDLVAPYSTIFYLLMYAGINASTCISGYVKPPGFRPTFKYFHWSVSFVGFVWCMGLSFLISSVATFCSMLAFLLLHAYIKKSRRLAATGVKWGTLGNAVRYNIVASALNQLAKHAASSSYPASADFSRAEQGVRLHSNSNPSSSSSREYRNNNYGVREEDPERDEWVHFHSNTDFHAKNWRPQVMTLVDVESDGTPVNLHVLSLAAQLQQTGRGINVVVSIIDRSAAKKAAEVAAAVDSICSEEDDKGDGQSMRDNEQGEDDSVISELSSTQFVPPDRWHNEEEIATLASTTTGIDHLETIKLIRRSKALLMIQMKKEGMDGFAEVSSTDGKFFEAVWSAVIHTGLGPLSPNTILLALPSFLDLSNIHLCDESHAKSGVSRASVVLRKDRGKAEDYLRTINGILNLGKAVILFKGSPSYPTNNGIILSKRGTIDIWWIVHDGGLLLLLPFLLSKHGAWCGLNPAESQKKGFRRKKKCEGALLRLFAVTTNTMEDPEKLREAVVEHLERVRIQAEVIVVNCLAGTNIAEYMRDQDSALPTGMPRRQRGLDRLGSLQEDGISTHHMTVGEVFANDIFDDQSKTTVKARNGIHSNVSSGNLSCGDYTDESLQLASKLNDAMQQHSGSANLVVTNLPNIQKDQNAENYFDFVATVCRGIDNVMMVRGSGAEVITAYA